MTNIQRKRVEKTISDLKQLIAVVSSDRDDLQNNFDDRSDKWKESEAGENVQSELDYLEQAVGSLENAKDELENAKGVSE